MKQIQPWNGLSRRQKGSNDNDNKKYNIRRKDRL